MVNSVIAEWLPKSHHNREMEKVFSEKIDFYAEGAWRGAELGVECLLILLYTLCFQIEFG